MTTKDKNRDILTIAFPKEWMNEVKRIAIQKSSENGVMITHLDLIRYAVIKEFNIDPGKHAKKKPELYGTLKPRKRIKK